MNIVDFGEDLRNPGKYIVPARDTRGQKENLWIPMQPAHLAAYGKIFESKLFPYVNRHDLGRHAIVRHLNILSQIAPVKSILSEADLITATSRANLYRMTMNDTLQVLHREVKQHLDEGEVELARLRLVEAGGHMRNMESIAERDGDDMEKEWARKFSKEFERQFGAFLGELWSSVNGSHQYAEGA